MRARIKRRERNRRVLIVALVAAIIVVFVVAGYYLTLPSALDSYVNKPVGTFPGSSLQTLKAAATGPYGSGGASVSNQMHSLTLSLLTSHGKPLFLYFGEDGCPYCAVMRWETVVALLRFGNFTNLKYMTSFLDGTDYPTFSFHGSTYSSPYVAFSAYEEYDRPGNPLDNPPSNYSSIYSAYASGFPFTYVAGKFYTPGALLPSGYTTTDQLTPIFAGQNWTSITTGIGNPNSQLGSIIKSGANVLTATICKVITTPDPAVCQQNPITTLSASGSQSQSGAATMASVGPSVGQGTQMNLILPRLSQGLD